MEGDRDAAGRGRRLVVLAVIYLLAALPVTFMFIVHPGLTGHPDADFGRVIDGTANRPYVARALIPFVVRAIDAAIPDSAHDRFAASMGDRRMIGLFGWEGDRLFQYAVATVLFVACFVGFAFVLRRLAMVVYDPPPTFADLSPLIALAALPLCFRYYSYPYDPATLLLFSLGVLYIIQDRTGPFVIVLILAALNKETSVLLVGLYGWKAARHGWKRGVTRAGMALSLWFVVRAALHLVFRDRPGAVVETHVDHTVWLFTEFPGRLFYALVVVGLFAAVALPGWRGKPRIARAGLLLTVVPLFVAALFLGFADELRGYYEAAPFVFLLSLPTIAHALGARVSRPA